MSQDDNLGAEAVSMRAGIGNWAAFNLTGFSPASVIAAAEDWAVTLRGMEYPWLCWNVNHDWCLAQQRLVEHAGWTPVVGFDPRIGRPALTPRAVCIDFNSKFGFPVMYPHFVIEFAFAFVPRLAFWHSDLLLRKSELRRAADMFMRLPDGSMAATKPADGRLAALRPRLRRYWELLGCMTRGASQRNFEKGCGWWLNFSQHPNCTDPAEAARRRRFHWECGTGIRYWHKHEGGDVVLIPERRIREGHFTRIGNRRYQTVSGTEAWRRDLTRELALNFELRQAARQLEIEDIVLR